MPKKSKNKKKAKKSKKKVTSKDNKQEIKKEDDNIIKIPEGNDWVILSFCLVPWEAKNITMFLNFEQLVKTNMTIKSLKRVIEDRIGSVSHLSFYLNPPKKEEELSLKDCQHFRLIDMDFKGGTFDNPERSLLFFDFSPSYPTDLGLDPLLLTEPSQILLNHSETVKQEIGQLLKTILNKKNVKQNNQ